MPDLCLEIESCFPNSAINSRISLRHFVKTNLEYSCFNCRLNVMQQLCCIYTSILLLSRDSVQPRFYFRRNLINPDIIASCRILFFLMITGSIYQKQYRIFLESISSPGRKCPYFRRKSTFFESSVLKIFMVRFSCFDTVFNPLQKQIVLMEWRNKPRLTNDFKNCIPINAALLILQKVEFHTVYILQ